MGWARWALGVLVLTGCSDTSFPEPGTQAQWNPDGGFFEAPFPAEHRRRDDGSLAVQDFPNPGDNALLQQLLTLLEEGRDGFSLNGGVFLPFTGPVDTERLQTITPASSVADDSPVFMVDVDPDSPERGRRIPIEVSFKGVAETYTPAHLLAVLPFQGVVLRAETTYAVVVRRDLGQGAGRALSQSVPLRELLVGGGPPSLAPGFAMLGAWLDDEGIDRADLAHATVFRTGEPLGRMQAYREQIASAPPVSLTDVTFVEEFPGYCVVGANVELPIFQRGPKPYRNFGEGLLVDEGGMLVEQERDRVGVILTIPKSTMPTAGFPMVLYAAGAEGKARQVVDRTRIDADPDEGLGPPGQGPAKIYAARGLATFGFTAPLTWDRNPENDGGLLDFWNVENLGAFRDNIRQGILDFSTLVPTVLAAELDPSVCPGATAPGGVFRFDPDALYLHGHSTGSTIGSAVIALEPDIDAVVLSGAGGSWIYNLSLAQAPVRLSTVAGLLLSYEPDDDIDIFDPTVTLFQTVMESIEVMDWGRLTVDAPRDRPKHVLLIEGLIDTYHFPRMVSAYGMSAGLDLAEPVLDDDAPGEYALVGRQVSATPLSANRTVNGVPVTAAVIMREQNEQDGHYVPFELDDVKYRYGCFLGQLAATGTAVVAGIENDPAAPCP